MVDPLQNQSARGIPEIFDYLEGLFNKIPDRAVVKFAQVPESLAQVPLDAETRRLITQSLFDATQNGQKYCSKGTDVFVSASEARNGRVVFQVSNEGRTMTFLERQFYGIFSGFRGKLERAMAPGLGKGAARIRDNIVNRLEGQLAVSARTGGGTVVRMTVPLVETSAESTSTFLMRTTTTLNSGARMLTKGATGFLLAVEAIPAATEATYNLFDDPCNVYARDEWYNSVNTYYSQAGLFGDIPNVPWYQKINNSTQLVFSMVLPSSAIKFVNAIDPFDDTAKNWMSAKANACRIGRPSK